MPHWWSLPKYAECATSSHWITTISRSTACTAGNHSVSGHAVYKRPADALAPYNEVVKRNRRLTEGVACRGVAASRYRGSAERRQVVAVQLAGRPSHRHRGPDARR